jgi:RNA polymerase sigma-70 factor, ECF subfamily
LTGAVFIEQIFQPQSMDVSNMGLIELLSRRDEAAFEQVFKANFKNLHAYACIMLKDEAAAEEMVQNVFFKLWERTEHISISGSVTAYLYRAVYNESLNYLKHLKVRSQHQLYVSYRMNSHSDNASRKIQLKELEDRIQIALNELPEQCRTIFQMSRFEELKYREIASRMNLSIKTVENQMGKALKILREKLVEFLPVLILLLNLLNRLS